MLGWKPFPDRPLAEVSLDDLRSLLDQEGMGESYYLEFKSDWVPNGVLKCVSAFANTDGGTVVIGIDTEGGTTPQKLSGVQLEGDLGEAIDNAIRNGVAPALIPNIRVISDDDGLQFALIEVPRGPERPYLVTRTGQVMRKTATSCSPADPTFVDQLFREGRLGEAWAAREWQRILDADNPDFRMASLWTFPRVANGLDIGLRLFTRDFQTRLIGQTVHVAEAFSAHKRDIDNFEVSDDELTTFAETLVPVGRLRMSVKVTGAISSSVQGDRIGQTPIERLLDVAPGAHGSLLADLGYAGSVDLAVRFLTKASLRFTVKAIPAPRLGNPTLFEELIRRVNRAQGYWDPETGTV